MKIRDYRTHFIGRLGETLGVDEAQSIFNIVLKNMTGMDRTRLALAPDAQFSPEDILKWNSILGRLCSEEPVQYILGETTFCGHTFRVTPDVLIPRPETEELVEWIASEAKNTTLKILDIGTGSGCIGISLALFLPNADVTVLDVSPSALEVARSNAKSLGANISFILADILTYNSEQKFDIIVSNPPYVRHLEKEEIKNNVLEHEPHLALFVEDDDALLFYRKISGFAQKALNPGGSLFFEINQYLGPQTVELLREFGFDPVELRKDIFGNDRMIRAARSYS